MSTDQRKMLEAAAKACGITLEREISGKKPHRLIEHESGEGHISVPWNPLTNPADTAEMCAKLRISVLYEHDPCEFLACFAHNSHDPEIAHYKDHDNSRMKAWMYAATMVCARIGGYTE